MPTAIFSGTAALMLQANPELDPHLIKLMLLLSARKMDQPEMLEQGNGLVNAKTAVELAQAYDTERATLSDEVASSWLLSVGETDETVWAGGAFALADQLVYSSLVDPSYLPSRQYDPPLFWGGGFDWSQVLTQAPISNWADIILLEASHFSNNSVSTPDSEGVSVDGISWSDGILWSDAFR